MSEDRSEMEAARLAGLQRRHEIRIESREELRQRTRQEVAEDIAAAIEERAKLPFRIGDIEHLSIYGGLEEAARIAREIGSRDPA